MAQERRAPEDLQEAVAATLRRLRGEIGQPGQSPAARQEPVLGPTLTGPGAPFVATSPAAASPPVQPDLLSRAEAEHEIPPNPSLRLAELRETLAKPDATDRQRPKLLPYMLSILALAVFAGIGWWAYRSINGTSVTGQVPVVAASQVPEKVPPTADQAAGTSTTSGDKTVYNEVAPGSAPEPKTEVLLAPPEAPQLPPTMDSTTSGSTTAPAPTTPPATASDAGSTSSSGATAPAAGSTGGSTTTDQAAASTGATTANGTTTAATSSPSNTTEPATAAPATTSNTAAVPATSTAATAATAAPGVTETLIPGASTSSSGASTAEPASVGAATTPTATSTANQAPAASAPETTDALAAAPLTVDNTPTPTTSTDSASTSSTAGAAAAPAAAPATTSSAAPASATPASPTTTQTASLGNYRIQLASLKSEAAAQKTWKRLSSKYKDVLASLTVHIQKVALTSGTYYRLQAGPFEDKTAAAAACAKLKALGQQCLVKP